MVCGIKMDYMFWMPWSISTGLCIFTVFVISSVSWVGFVILVSVCCACWNIIYFAVVRKGPPPDDVKDKDKKDGEKK